MPPGRRDPAVTAVELRPQTIDAGFPTVFGRELIQELPNFVHRPYVVVTMGDLWPGLEHHFDGHLAAVHEVTTIEVAALDEQVAALPEFGAVVGLGGGRALDVAKFFAWRRGRPLFQAPTSMGTNAAFAHRAALTWPSRALARAPRLDVRHRVEALSVVHRSSGPVSGRPILVRFNDKP